MSKSSRYITLSRLPGSACSLEIVADSLSYRKLIRKNLDIRSYNRELHIYQRLHSSFFPALFDAYIDNFGGHIILTYIQGRTLDEIIKEEELSLERIIHIGISLCEALSCLHSMCPAIIHLDLKPSNLILTEVDEIAIIDFGSAEEVWSDINDNRSHYGTRGYAPPEQSGGIVDVRADIFAVGKILGRMLSEVSGVDRRCREYRKIRAIIWKACAADPSNRYESAGALEECLSELLRLKSIWKGRLSGVVLLSGIILFGMILFGARVSKASWDSGIFVEEEQEMIEETGLLNIGSLVRDKAFEIQIERLMEQGEDFECDKGELSRLLFATEDYIYDLIKESDKHGDCLSGLHKLCHIYFLREDILEEQMRLRVPEIARNGILLIHKMKTGYSDQKLLMEERYFTECLITILYEKGDKRDEILLEGYRDRVKEIDKELEAMEIENQK